MGYRLRQIPSDLKFCQAFELDVFSSILPTSTIEQVLDECHAWQMRQRALNMVCVIWFIIALNLYSVWSQATVWRKVSAGLRYVWPDPDVVGVTAAALCYRRKQLGAEPMYRLFRRVCHPLASAETKGAYRFGYRLMAIDGTLEDVAKSQANEEYFGRVTKGKTASPFAQVRGVYLVECGTHAIVDASLSPARIGEGEGAEVLLRSVDSRMLVLLDRGFFSGELLWQVRQKGAHALVRLKANTLKCPWRVLADGSYLALLPVKKSRRGKKTEKKTRDKGKRLVGKRTREVRVRRPPLLLRVISYTITDPAIPGAGKTHRLATTLLNPSTAPALDLIDCYHERWEIESTIDELDTHQRLADRPLRSKTPEGVKQELYGLLLAHYAVRALMHQSACCAHLDPDQLSFTHALSTVQEAIREFAMTEQAQHGDLLARLLRDLRCRDSLLPARRMRCNPRVVKRRFSKFPKKQSKHLHVPDLKKAFLEAVAVI